MIEAGGPAHNQRVPMVDPGGCPEMKDVRGPRPSKKKFLAVWPMEFARRVKWVRPRRDSAGKSVSMTIGP